MKELMKFDIYDGKMKITGKVVRISRWIKIKQNYTPNKNNGLWDYVTDENGYHPYQEQFKPENGLFLDYFTFKGKNYAVEQFAGFGSIMDIIGHHTGYIENNEQYFLSGFDMDNYYLSSPLLIELDEYCENVRLYMEV